MQHLESEAVKCRKLTEMVSSSSNTTAQCEFHFLSFICFGILTPPYFFFAQAQ